MKFEKTFTPYNQVNRLLNYGGKVRLDNNRRKVTDFKYYLKINSAYYANEFKSKLNNVKNLMRIKK